MERVGVCLASPSHSVVSVPFGETSPATFGGEQYGAPCDKRAPSSPQAEQQAEKACVPWSRRCMVKQQQRPPFRAGQEAQWQKHTPRSERVLIDALRAPGWAPALLTRGMVSNAAIRPIALTNATAVRRLQNMLQYT